MKALIYDGPWKIRIAELPDPAPGRGEVLLRSLAVGICGSDIHGYTGESGRRQPGMVMGHEVVGEVVARGPDANRLEIGDNVAVYNIVGCSRCEFCNSGRDQLCLQKKVLGVNAGTWGAMAEYFTFPESGLFKLPPAMDPAIGLLTEPVAVAAHAIHLMQPKSDDVIAIVGTGTIGIGLAIVLLARDVRSVYALDRVPDKLTLIADFGAIPVNVDQVDPVAFIRAQTKGRGAQGVFEAVGAAATVRTAYDLVATGGSVVLIGNLAKEISLPLQGITSNETTLRGSYGFTKRDFKEAVDLVATPGFPLQRLITGSCSLEEAPEAFRRMAAGELSAIKMVIRP